MQQAAGGDFAFARLVAAAAVVADENALPFDAGGDEGGEVGGVAGVAAAEGRLQAQAVGEPFAVEAGGGFVQQAFQPFTQGGEVFGKDARLQFVEDVLDGEDGLQFVGAEP